MFRSETRHIPLNLLQSWHTLFVCRGFDYVRISVLFKIKTNFILRRIVHSSSCCHTAQQVKQKLRPEAPGLEIWDTSRQVEVLRPIVVSSPEFHQECHAYWYWLGFWHGCQLIPYMSYNFVSKYLWKQSTCNFLVLSLVLGQKVFFLQAERRVVYFLKVHITQKFSDALIAFQIGFCKLCEFTEIFAFFLDSARCPLSGTKLV